MSSMHQMHFKLFMTSKGLGEREIKIQIWHESLRGWSGNIHTDHSYFVWLKSMCACGILYAKKTHGRMLFESSEYVKTFKSY